MEDDAAHETRGRIKYNEWTEHGRIGQHVQAVQKPRESEELKIQEIALRLAAHDHQMVGVVEISSWKNVVHKSSSWSKGWKERTSWKAGAPDETTSSDSQCSQEQWNLHCADPGLEQERITHYVPLDQAASCVLSFVKDRVACCLPTCAQVSFVSVSECVVNGAFWGFLGAPGGSVYMEGRGVLALLVYPACSQSLGAGVPVAEHADWAEAGGRHDLRSLLGVHWVPLKCAREGTDNCDGGICRNWFDSGNYCVLPYVPALISMPSLHGYYACMVHWNRGALQGNCRQHLRKTLFPLVLGWSV